MHFFYFRMEYCQDLIHFGKYSLLRGVLNRALQSLPVSQHEKVWQVVIAWVKESELGLTAKHLFDRYLMFDQSSREDYITFLKEMELYDEAAIQLSECLNDPNFKSTKGLTHHQLWMDLCALCANFATKVVHKIDVEGIMRSGIRKFSDEVGKLWIYLAQFYIRLGLFEKARDIYEEAIHNVTSVRDFATIFDSYIKVEESILAAKMRYLQESELDEEEKAEEASEVNLRLSRMEYLMEARPLLLNSVLLRQNANNVFQWRKRIKLLSKDPRKTLLTFAEATKTIHPEFARGRLSSLWISWARTYERFQDLAKARDVFENALKVEFKSVDEVAEVLCAWAELEIRNGNVKQSFHLLQNSLDDLGSRKTVSKAHSAGLSKNVKAWNLYLDLEEFLGTVESCKIAYDRVFDLKIVTVQMVLNYAMFLEENAYFEDSFKVYERAVQIFEFPNVKLIWDIYLDKFGARYGSSKINRLRDLYEQVLQRSPKENLADFYLKCIAMETTYGSPRHVLAIFDKAVKEIPETQRLDMYRLYIKKTEELQGILKTRDIYSEALKILSDEMAQQLCLDYFKMERNLGEIDRARAILQYGSQFADPRRYPEFWKLWREFEEASGNEDTFKEMLRIERSLEATFSQV
jgi:pre-mRNA-splicing factor SYF1